MEVDVEFILKVNRNTTQRHQKDKQKYSINTTEIQTDIQQEYNRYTPEKQINTTKRPKLIRNKTEIH